MNAVPFKITPCDTEILAEYLHSSCVNRNATLPWLPLFFGSSSQNLRCTLARRAFLIQARNSDHQVCWRERPHGEPLFDALLGF